MPKNSAEIRGHCLLRQRQLTGRTAAYETKNTVRSMHSTRNWRRSQQGRHTGPTSPSDTRETWDEVEEDSKSSNRHRFWGTREYLDIEDNGQSETYEEKIKMTFRDLDILLTRFRL